MMKRFKVNRRKDRKTFSKTVRSVDDRNLFVTPPRGGYRL